MTTERKPIEVPSAREPWVKYTLTPLADGSYSCTCRGYTSLVAAGLAATGCEELDGHLCPGAPGLRAYVCAKDWREPPRLADRLHTTAGTVRDVADIDAARAARAIPKPVPRNLRTMVERGAIISEAHELARAELLTRMREC